MPWVNVVTSRQLTEIEQERVKNELADILLKVLDKEEGGLVITFLAAYSVYRGGQSSPESAVVEINYVGQFPLAKKQEVTRLVCRTLADAAKADTGRIAVLFTESSSENWGRNAGDYH